MTPSIINGAFDFTEELGKMSDMSQDGGEELIHEESRPKHELCCQKLDQFATKNVIIISVCFLLLFTAFNGLQYLQSSIHTAEGLGLATISILYAVLAASNLFSLAPAVISKVGHKWTMVVSMGAYLFWVLMNGHATWFTMVPAAVLVGLAAGPLWVSQSAYLTITATSVANQSGESMGAITHRYFGVFAFLFSLSHLLGPAISSSTLHVSGEGMAVHNSSYAATLWTRCGARDCPGNLISETAIEPQHPNKVWLMVGLYAGCILLAMLIMALTLDNVPRPTEPFTIAHTWRTVSSVIRHHRHWRQLVLIPVYLHQGWFTGFIFGEFTKSFGSCVFGVWMVGVITLPFGLAQPVVSLAAGGLVKYIGRLSLMMVAQFGDVALLITMLFWDGRGGLYVVYTLSCLVSVTSSIRNNILSGTVSCSFPECPETAFCAVGFWEAFAWIIPFAYGQYLCTSTKLWVLLGITIMAICGFITLENPCRANKSVYKKVTQDEDETEISCVDEESAYKELTQHEDEADGDIDQSESDTDL